MRPAQLQCIIDACTTHACVEGERKAKPKTRPPPGCYSVGDRRRRRLACPRTYVSNTAIASAADSTTTHLSTIAVGCRLTTSTRSSVIAAELFLTLSLLSLKNEARQRVSPHVLHVTPVHSGLHALFTQSTHEAWTRTDRPDEARPIKDPRKRVTNLFVPASRRSRGHIVVDIYIYIPGKQWRGHRRRRRRGRTARPWHRPRQSGRFRWPGRIRGLAAGTR